MVYTISNAQQVSIDKSITEINDGPSATTLSFVLNLTLNDVNRAIVLFQSLIQHKNALNVEELIVIAPDNDVQALYITLYQWVTELGIDVRFVRESTLMKPTSQHYVNQMLYKLAASTIVKTSHYITLDADVIMTNRLNFAFTQDGKAAFTPEPKEVHPTWWNAAEQILMYTPLESETVGFGVTPSILSKFGAQAALQRIRSIAINTYNTQIATEESQFRSVLDPNADWADIMVLYMQSNYPWSDYTLYSTALRSLGLFNDLHIPEQVPISCGNVWYDNQLPWDISIAKNNNCWFSVVQSSSGADVSNLFTQVVASSSTN